MKRYKLVISYDGTNYAGWQIQPNAVTIQQVIQDRLLILLKSPVHLIGSGRTDSGVHARAQVAHFDFEGELSLRKFLHSLNALLPPDIRVKSIEEVSTHFHSQYSAVGKEYHYHIYLDPVLDPFWRFYSWHLRYSTLDMEKLVECLPLFCGTHDFTSFANEADRGSAGKDPVRTISRLEAHSFDGGMRLEFEGDGFLYKMVRNITGTLVAIARGKLSIDDISLIFSQKNRSAAAESAPPQGLFLVNVFYN